MISEKTSSQITLRPYQVEALDGIFTRLDEGNSTLLVMATGLSKTAVFSRVVREFINLGRVKVLAHREELIGQAWRH
jgi:superfamily II DNA or RNA helicase